MHWKLWWCVAMVAGADAAELPITPMASYRAQAYTTSDGLGNESLLHVTRLHDGRVLISGVSDEPLLFDGHRFSGLPYAQPQSFASTGALATLEASDGGIWIASNPGGLLHFRNGQLQSVALPDGASRPFSLGLARDGRRLLVPTSKGVFAFDSTQPASPPQRLTSVEIPATVALEDRDSTLWIGTSQGLYRKAADSDVLLAEPQLANIHIWTLFLDRRGRVLIGTRGLGLLIHEAGAFQRISRAEGLPHDIVRGVAELDDALWIATAGGGIARYDGQRISVFNSSNGLSSDTVTAITADDRGVLWATTAGAGLNRLWPSAFTNYADATGKRGGFHYAIHRDRGGQIWFGSNLGLAHLLGDVVVPDGQPAPGQSGTVLGIVDHPQRGLLLSTRRGLFQYVDGRFAAVPGASDLQTPVLWRSARLGLLVGSGHRLFQWGDGQLRLLAALPDGDSQILSLDDDPKLGALLATSDGAFAYEGGVLTSIGPRGRRTGGFWRDGDRLYVSGRSLAMYDGASWIELGDPPNPSSQSSLYNIVPDRTGGVWVSTRDGLLRYERAELRVASAGVRLSPVSFGLRDGLPSTEFEGSPQGVLRDDDGSIWFASTGGITRLQADRVGRSPEHIQLALHAVDNEVQRFPAQEDLSLPAGTRRVALSFAALPASHSSAVQIHYRLLPIEKNYRSDRGQREAVYGGLGPGDYQLELIGEIAGLTPVQGRLNYRFSIQPRWLERVEVQVAFISLLFLLMAALPTWHIRALRAQRRRLIAEVADKTSALEALARSDGLTGLDNRRAFDASLAAALATRAAVGLILLDVDHFKKYNDTLGHQAGDECLRRIAAALLAQATQQGASAARIGGEEFAALLGDADWPRLQALADRLRKTVAELAIAHPAADSGRVGISIGVALAHSGESGDSLLRRADAALYRAKQRGRDRVECA